jgi:hypothetical protein
MDRRQLSSYQVVDVLCLVRFQISSNCPSSHWFKSHCRHCSPSLSSCLSLFLHLRPTATSQLENPKLVSSLFKLRPPPLQSRSICWLPLQLFLYSNSIGSILMCSASLAFTDNSMSKLLVYPHSRAFLTIRDTL